MFEALKPVFSRWGCPQYLRVDNGAPFGSPKSSTTSALALCLLAYGIRVVANAPAQPQQNGKVERQQGTSARWAEVKQSKSLEEATRKTQQAVLIQREQYPVSRLKGQTRLQKFPELASIQRPWQHMTFEVQRVYDFLAQKQYVRKVSKNAQITHFSHKMRIGTAYCGQSICLKFNAFTLHWEVYAANGDFIKCSPAEYLQPERIKNMTVYSKN